MRLYIIYMVLICASTVMPFVVHDSVIFQKRAEVSATHTSWRLSLVIDLSFYQSVLTEVWNGLNTLVDSVDHHFGVCKAKPDCKDWVPSLNLKDALQAINESRSLIFKDYWHYHSLSRTKRSLLPFIGKAFSWLIGTADEGEIDELRGHVTQLERNQKKIIHVVKKSLSLINITRQAVVQNRNTINKLITGLSSWMKSLEVYEDFMNRIHSRIVILMEIVRQLNIAVEDLKTQINFLSLGKLTPSAINPHELRTILLELKDNLPQSVILPSQPLTHIWNFYRQLTCSTVILDEKLVIMIDIPLLSSRGRMEIYEAHNLPIPHPDHTDHSQSIVSLEYNLESTKFIIDIDRANYALLDDETVATCVQDFVDFCSLRQPFFRVATSHSCVIALFTRNNNRIEKDCHKIVSFQQKFPKAFYLANGAWIIVLLKPITFTVVCHSHQSSITTEVIAKPPTDVIELKTSCSAASDSLLLKEVYMGENHYVITDHLVQQMAKYPHFNFSIWKNFQLKFPRFNHTKLPSTLRNMDKTSLNELEDTLDEIHFSQQSAPTTWYYWTILPIIVAAMIIALLLYKRKYILQIIHRKNTPATEGGPQADDHDADEEE